MSKKILVAGCWRSGSTAVFNVCRIICLEHGSVYACFEDAYEEEVKGFDFEIVKVHKFRRKWVDWADKIVTIEREPADIWASMKRWGEAGKREFTLEDFGRGLTWWGKYHKHDDYAAHYNQLTRSTEKLARKIGEALGLKINERMIVKKFRAIKPPKSGVDPVTLLHAGHVTKK